MTSTFAFIYEDASFKSKPLWKRLILNSIFCIAALLLTVWYFEFSMVEYRPLMIGFGTIFYLYIAFALYRLSVIKLLLCLAIELGLMALFLFLLEEPVAGFVSEWYCKHYDCSHEFMPGFGAAVYALIILDILLHFLYSEVVYWYIKRSQTKLAT